MKNNLAASYQRKNLPTIQLGGIVLNDALIPEGEVHLVLKNFNRHGLIAGATGTGKTKTMQVLAEELSLCGVPSLVMDVKGDISGLAEPGEKQKWMMERNQSLNLNYNPQAFPVEMLTLNPSFSSGTPLRASIGEFGPLLFSRLLDLNDTQTGVITLLFEFAKVKSFPLIELKHLKSLLQWVQTKEGHADIEKQFGAVAFASIGALMRKVVELETQAGNCFFGKPSFDIQDLIRTDQDGRGIISILRVIHLDENAKIFSTFMLKLLTDLYRKLPELGDPSKPKLVIFIDEAHLIFNNATKALLNLLETTVKLIRSKGVGIIFCTQNPTDLPDVVLSQLGLKIQHALRAFTAKDRKAMKLMAQNFPPSDYYNTEELLTSLKTGEALLTALDEQGQPSPLVECMIRAPQSRMGILSNEELTMVVNQSKLIGKYNQKEPTTDTFFQSTEQKIDVKKSEKHSNQDNHVFEKIAKNTLFRQVFRQVVRDVTKAILSALGINNRKR